MVSVGHFFSGYWTIWAKQWLAHFSILPFYLLRVGRLDRIGECPMTELCSDAMDAISSWLVMAEFSGGYKIPPGLWFWISVGSLISSSNASLIWLRPRDCLPTGIYSSMGWFMRSCSADWSTGGICCSWNTTWMGYCCCYTGTLTGARPAGWATGCPAGGCCCWYYGSAASIGFPCPARCWIYWAIVTFG